LLVSAAIRRENTFVSYFGRRGVAVRIALACACATLISSSGPAADPISEDVLVRRLIDALKDSDTDVRQNLAATLAKIGPAAVEPLTAALKDAVPERRAGAAYSLGLIGPTAKSSLPQLLDMLDDKELDVRRQAAYAVSRIVPSGVKPTAPTGVKQ
jgi:HEAT repeat protein